jgi:hypothetical protein
MAQDDSRERLIARICGLEYHENRKGPIDGVLWVPLSVFELKSKRPTRSG